jgi:N-acetylglutamate synthase-like GNAT family acetyltransferase
VARLDEAAQLSELALRSKASWGYDAGFMAACVASLTLTAEQMQRQSVFVIEAANRIAGFGSLRIDGDDAELTNLFIEPWAKRQGYGKQLWDHAVALAQASGVKHIRIESDPFAEGFYLTMGAQRIGDVPSDAIPGRRIPLLSFEVPGGRTSSRGSA